MRTTQGGITLIDPLLVDVRGQLNQSIADTAALTHGILTINAATGSSPVALTAEQTRAALLVFTGTLSANKTFTVPATETARKLLIANSTSGGYGITIKLAGEAGAGVAIAAGETKHVYHDGVNMVGVMGGGASSTMGLVSVKDYGAVGDGATDDAGAIQDAGDAIINGTAEGALFFPPGTYRIATPVLWNLSGSGCIKRMVGAGGDASKIFVDLTNSQVALKLTNSTEAIHIADLVLHGDPAVNDDCLRVWEFATCEHVTFERVHHYGLAALQAGGAIIIASESRLFLKDSNFLGCSTSSGVSTSIVSVSNWKNLRVTHCSFKDFGVLEGVSHEKTALASPLAWIAAARPSASDRGNYQGQCSIVVEHCRFDEGALSSLSATSNVGGGEPTINSLTYRDNVSNVGNLGNKGVTAVGVDHVIVENSLFGYATSTPGYIVYYRDCLDVTVRRCWSTSVAGHVYHDADVLQGGILRLEDSIFTDVYSATQDIACEVKATGGSRRLVLSSATTYSYATLHVFSGGSGIATSADYITGLRLEWVSATSIKVKTGAAMVDGVMRTVASDITLSSLSLGNNAFGHVYLVNNTTAECNTTAPTSLGFGTVYHKTGDASRRYLGSVRTDGSGNIYQFRHYGSNRIRYLMDAPLILNPGDATTETAVSCSTYVPVTSRTAIIHAINTSTNATFYLGAGTGAGDDSVAPPTTGILVIGVTGGAKDVIEEIPLNASQEFSYAMSTSPSSPGYVYLLGYIFER